MPAPLFHLATLVAAVLSQGCCGGYDTEQETIDTDHDGVVSGAALQSIQQDTGTPESRCAAACRVLAEQDGVFDGTVVECDAEANGADPWDPATLEVEIACTTSETHTIQVPPTCGRRPQGHHELGAPMDSAGRWLAVAAHLERASVRAFLELAEALALHGAPPDLIARCHAAASDEIVHARLMTMLARREGARVPACVADDPRRDLLSIALHNATEGCVHEAFAAVLAAAQARAVEDPECRRAFARIAVDECEHGQLAWDLHAWLVGALGPIDRAQVEDALALALAELPARALADARRTPSGLGWPSPGRAAGMADHFASLVSSRAHHV